MGKSEELVPKFDGTNFAGWGRRMANLLVEKELDEVVRINPITLELSETPPLQTVQSAEASGGENNERRIRQIKHG